MADLTDLVRAVSQRAVVLVDTAADDFVGWNLARVVPVGEPDPLGRPRTGPVLKDTYFRNPTRSSSDTVSVELGYTAPQAIYSNDLMPPHVITPRRSGYPLRFMVSDGTVVRTMLVNHPGNVNSASRGWWDNAVSGPAWTLALEAAGRYLS